MDPKRQRSPHDDRMRRATIERLRRKLRATTPGERILEAARLLEDCRALALAGEAAGGPGMDGWRRMRERDRRDHLRYRALLRACLAGER